MRRIATITTVLTFTLLTLGWVPTSSADANFAELRFEDHYTEQGYEIDVAVTESSDGAILSEVTIADPKTTDEFDVWTDGTTVWWSGIENGQPVRGSASAAQLVGLDDTQALICLHPVGALLCLAGVIAVMASEGCGYGLSCTGETPGGDPSNVPDGGGGGGGDGETEGDGDGSGDDD